MGQKKSSLFNETELFNREIGNMLFKHRRPTKISLGKYAKVINVNKNSISKNERGETGCTLYNLYLAIHFFDIPKDQILNILYDKKYLPEIFDDAKEEFKDELVLIKRK